MPVRTETRRVKAKTRQSSARARTVGADARDIDGADGEQCAHTEVAGGEAENSAGKRQKQAFGEQFAHDARAGGAESGADGEFAGAARGTRQQQVGDVGAGDQQDEADGADEQDRAPGARRRRWRRAGGWR